MFLGWSPEIWWTCQAATAAQPDSLPSCPPPHALHSPLPASPCGSRESCNRFSFPGLSSRQTFHGDLLNSSRRTVFFEPPVTTPVKGPLHCSCAMFKQGNQTWHRWYRLLARLRLQSGSSRIPDSSGLRRTPGPWQWRAWLAGCGRLPGFSADGLLHQNTRESPLFERLLHDPFYSFLLLRVLCGFRCLIPSERFLSRSSCRSTNTRSVLDHINLRYRAALISRFA